MKNLTTRQYLRSNAKKIKKRPVVVPPPEVVGEEEDDTKALKEATIHLLQRVKEAMARAR